MACSRIQLCKMTIAWSKYLQTMVGGGVLGSLSACPSLPGRAAMRPTPTIPWWSAPAVQQE